MKTKCLYPKCKRAPRARGLCNSHHAMANAAVKEGKTSWIELERRKKVLPEKKRGPKKSQWFVTRTETFVTEFKD